MVCSLRSKLWLPLSGQRWRLWMCCALKETRSVQKAEIPGGCGCTQDGPSLQMLPGTRTSELLFFVLFSLRSCCYAGDAVAF